MYGHVAVCEFLTAEGVDLAPSDHEAGQPLHYAAASGQLAAVQCAGEPTRL